MFYKARNKDPNTGTYCSARKILFTFSISWFSARNKKRSILGLFAFIKNHIFPSLHWNLSRIPLWFFLPFGCVAFSQVFPKTETKFTQNALPNRLFVVSIQIRSTSTTPTHASPFRRPTHQTTSCNPNPSQHTTAVNQLCNKHCIRLHRKKNQPSTFPAPPPPQNLIDPARFSHLSPGETSKRGWVGPNYLKGVASYQLG